MDAVVFQKEWDRMCRSYDDCKECPLRSNGCSDGLGASLDIAKKRVETVEQWSKGHPIITNRMKFEEMFGIDDQQIEMNSDSYMPTVTIPSSILMRSWWDAEYRGGEDND